MAIPQEKIEQVRLASDVVDVVSGYVTLKKRGKNYFGLCPFHQEKSASFSVNPGLQIFHCFGCGAGGNVFTFVMRIEGLIRESGYSPRPRALSLPRRGISQLRKSEALITRWPMVFYGYVTRAEAEPARRYLASRGMTPEALPAHIGYSLNKWDDAPARARKSLTPICWSGRTGDQEGGWGITTFPRAHHFAIHP